MIKVAPSLLAADLLNIGAELSSVRESGADWLHFDVMDGNFVPNISFGPAILKACASTGVICDAHLMIADPDKYIEKFVAAGAKAVTVHAETCSHLQKTLEDIRKLGCLAGVALNPGTDPSCLCSTLHSIDKVLIMTVEPGFGGQKLIPHCLEKIPVVRKMLESIGSNALIEVDGGVTIDNAAHCVECGADVLVAGTSFFKAEDRRAFVESLHALGK